MQKTPHSSIPTTMAKGIQVIVMFVQIRIKKSGVIKKSTRNYACEQIGYP
ncbi:hypothetical protein (plasmid) [Metabacillus dongyingensis]|nr:hypothetical protein [Metabacillus dongyingensis]